MKRALLAAGVLALVAVSIYVGVVLFGYHRSRMTAAEDARLDAEDRALEVTSDLYQLREKLDESNRRADDAEAALAELQEAGGARTPLDSDALAVRIRALAAEIRRLSDDVDALRVDVRELSKNR